MSGDLALRDHAISLEQLLAELCKFGRPCLRLMDGGWYCNIEMLTTTAGTDFKVASDFRLSDPGIAARMCLDRVHAAVSAITR